MIKNIRGKIIDIEEKFLIIETGQIGYCVFVTKEMIESVQINSEINLYTSFIVREQSQDLYGFYTKMERSLFELLITISGIGPKSALAILDLDNAGSLLDAIKNENATYLTQVSGIGKKTAEKIILELKEKAQNLDYKTDSLTSINNSGKNDIIDILVAMGYGIDSARQAFRSIKNQEDSTDSLIKEALRFLNS